MPFYFKFRHFDRHENSSDVILCLYKMKRTDCLLCLAKNCHCFYWVSCKEGFLWKSHGHETNFKSLISSFYRRNSLIAICQTPSDLTYRKPLLLSDWGLGTRWGKCMDTSTRKASWAGDPGPKWWCTVSKSLSWKSLIQGNVDITEMISRSRALTECFPGCWKTRRPVGLYSGCLSDCL